VNGATRLHSVPAAPRRAKLKWDCIAFWGGYTVLWAVVIAYLLGLL
jgi:hypothetical protein